MKKPLLTIKNILRPLLTGMGAIIPALATIWIVVFFIKLLSKTGFFLIKGALNGLNWLRGGSSEELKEFKAELWTSDRFPGDQLLCLFVPLALLFLVGLIVMNKPGKKIVSWIDETMTHVPVIGFIYASIKQFIDALKNLGNTQKYQGVAYIEYPSPGCRLIGFITGSYLDPLTNKATTSVFIPTSPNPMTGFVVLVDDEKVIPSAMSLEQATKMILSAGLVAPHPSEKLNEEKGPSLN